MIKPEPIHDSKDTRSHKGVLFTDHPGEKNVTIRMI